MDETYNTYTTTSLGSTSTTSSLGVGFIIASVVIALAFYAYTAIALGKIFKKAGIASWIAWVPFYNMWKLFEIGQFNGALSLLILIPFAGPFIYLVLSIIACYRIGLSFGKSGAYVLLYVFLSPIWLGLLGFGRDQWNGAQQQPAQGNTNVAPNNIYPSNSAIFQNNNQGTPASNYQDQPPVNQVTPQVNSFNQAPAATFQQGSYDQQPTTHQDQPVQNSYVAPTEQPVANQFERPSVQQPVAYQDQPVQSGYNAPIEQPSVQQPVAPVIDTTVEPIASVEQQPQQQPQVDTNWQQPSMPQPTKEPMEQQDSDYNNKIFPNQ
jgi:hypothetical protein